MITSGFEQRAKLKKEKAKNLRQVILSEYAAFASTRLLNWGEKNRRRFPWRRKKTKPFHVLIAEVLLRKTRAEAVVPVFEDLVIRFPSPNSLASANVCELAEILRPVGLFKIRAHALINISQAIVNKHNGEIPQSYEELIQLPHVGRYIANAVLCFSFGKDTPLVDSSIQRVLKRAFGLKEAVEIHKADHLWNAVVFLIPKGKAREFNFAMLDFGAKVCKPRNPVHCGCPISEICKEFKLI